MKTITSYHKAKSYIVSRSPYEGSRRGTVGPAITISRQTGIGAEEISKYLIEYLDARLKNKKEQWVYFDKNLIKKVMEDHNLPEHFVKYLNDIDSSEMSTAFSEILGLTPSKVKLLHKTSETIHQLAKIGNVIIVGRGANIIADKLKNCLHVRLVAPMEHRARQASDLYSKDHKMEMAFIKKEDTLRKAYIKKYFHKDIDDPLLYHMVLNTWRLTFEETAETIGNVVINKFPKYFAPFD